MSDASFTEQVSFLWNYMGIGGKFVVLTLALYTLFLAFWAQDLVRGYLRDRKRAQNLAQWKARNIHPTNFQVDSDNIWGD